MVSDDELHLGHFAAEGAEPGTVIRLFPGALPDKPRPRKKQKPDLEILLRLPPFERHAYGALLALGSGSRAQRERGALLALDARGLVRGAVQVIDASPLYGRLNTMFDDLNLEGAWVHEDALFLLQRGNKGQSPNAVIELDFAAVTEALLQERILPPLAPRALTEMDLGEIKGVPLCFTDAAGLPDGRWVFSAVAEDTDDARRDGEFLGAMIGLTSPAHQVQWQRRVKPARKIEGVEVRMKGGNLQLLCVTDADDPAVPAQLLVSELVPLADP